MSEINTDEQLLNDYKTIIESPNGSYQTPLNQLELIALLAKTNNARKVLEIGTFKGFTSLYLSLKLDAKTQITTCESLSDNITSAKALWRKYGAKNINILKGDAAKNIDKLTEKYDLIYIDADKKQYPRYYESAKRLCKKGGLILIDNMLWAGLVASKKTGYSHATLLRDLNQKKYEDDNDSVSMIPAWDGLIVVRQ